MATIYPPPWLIYICDDGEGGGELHVVAADGAKQVQVLSPKIAAKLIRDLSLYLLEPPVKTPVA